MTTATRREFLWSSSSAFLLLTALNHDSIAFAQDCATTYDPTCVIESVTGSSDFDDSASDDAGIVGDGTVEADSDPNSYVVNPSSAETQIQADTLSTSEEARVWAQIFAALGLGFALAGAEPVALGFEIVAFSLEHFVADPAAPNTGLIRTFSLPPNRPNLSGSLTAQDAALQTAVFHVTSLALAISAFTTTHERYLGAVQQAVTKPTAQTVKTVEAQAIALGSNATACATVCGWVASDLTKLAPWLASGNLTPTTPSAIAAKFQQEWPETRATMQMTYKYGTNSLAGCAKIATGLLKVIRTMSKVQVSVAGQPMVVSIPAAAGQIAALASAAGTSLPVLGSKFAAIGRTVDAAKWPIAPPGTTPPVPICPAGEVLQGNGCVKKTFINTH